MAAVPAASISNLVSHNYMSVYHDYLQQEYGAKPHVGGIVDRLWERSAIRFVSRVKTPVMFVHGDNDQLVNPAEIEQFFIALKDVGVETLMVRYPREGHGMRENGHIADGQTFDRLVRNAFSAVLHADDQLTRGRFSHHCPSKQQ